MKTKIKPIIMTIIILSITIFTPIVSGACGGSWGEDVIPKMLKK